MKILIVKQLNNTFKAAYDSDMDKLRKIKVGEVVECEIKKKRNIKFHRKAFGLFNLVYQNQEHYNDLNHLRHDLTIAAGYYTQRINLNGETITEAKSISFAKMDEHEFSEYYNAILDQIVKYFKFDRQAIEEEIIRYF